ncbi:MAG: PAS domain-containing protein [Gammaproteobacteria bacterium]|nr:PAS domain-containing protein [Gammaproteobacteria bacterium]
MQQQGINTNKKLADLSGYTPAAVGLWFKNDNCSELAAKTLSPILHRDWQYIKYGTIGSDQPTQQQIELNETKLTIYLDLALKAGQFITWEIDLKSDSFNVSEAFYDIIPREQIEHNIEGLINYIHKDDRSTVKNAISAAIHDLDGNTHTVVYRVINKQTQVITHRKAWARVIFDHIDRPVKIIGISCNDPDLTPQIKLKL